MFNLIDSRVEKFEERCTSNKITSELVSRYFYQIAWVCFQPFTVSMICFHNQNRYVRGALLKAFFVAVTATFAACQSQTPSGLSDLNGALGYPPENTKITVAEKSARRGEGGGYTVTVLAPDGVKGRFSREDGSKGEIVPGCWGCGGGRSIEEEKYAALWPLRVGKSVEFTRTRKDGSRSRHRITVTGARMATTLLGEVEVFVLRGQIRDIDGGSRWRAELTDWWSPQVGWIVKSVGKDSRGRSFDLEITSVTKPG